MTGGGGGEEHTTTTTTTVTTTTEASGRSPTLLTASNLLAFNPYPHTHTLPPSLHSRSNAGKASQPPPRAEHRVLIYAQRKSTLDLVAEQASTVQESHSTTIITL